MRVGQVSKMYFCSWCGEPAVGDADPKGNRYWATPCPHAAPVKRMGPKQRARTIARLQAINEHNAGRQRQVIADCAGQPAGGQS
jgi:hypothetical protein